MTENDTKYWAFISYSHQDKKWGDWLHKALETYRVPTRFVGCALPHGGRIPKRLMPIFRDREELPTATDLGQVITESLLQSRYLIVICSPRSAQSRWVNEEILAFKRMGKANCIMALIVDGEPLFELRGHTNWINSVAISADGKRILTGSSDKTIKVWNSEKPGEPLLTIHGHEERVNSVTFDTDEKRIVSGSLDGTVRTWDAATGKEILILRGHQGTVNSVAINASGHRIVSACGDGTIQVWDAENGGEALLTLKEHESEVTSVSFSPDGKQFVSGSLDGTIKVWHIEKSDSTMTLRGHEDGVTSVSFSADGQRIASGSSSFSGETKGEIKIWDAVRGGNALLTLRGDDDRINAVAFSDDGQRIASGGDRSTIKVW